MVEPENVDEILQLAIDKEVEAYNFYMAVSNAVTDLRVRVAFEELAKEELEHKAKLELEVMKLGQTISVEQNPARPERNYIVSNDPSPLDMDYKDILMLGMAKEEAAFRTYVKLAANVHDKKSQEVLLTLAEEEVKHKLRFQTEYDILLKKR
jgi:rubrerythrin